MTEPLAPDVVTGFLDVVVRHLRSTVGLEARIVAIPVTGCASHAIAVAIDFHGDVLGSVTWVFPRPVALELVRRLMCDPDPPADTATDGATELANILTGGASKALERHGLCCEFGVPRVHEGELPGGIAVQMTTVKGPIDIVLSMYTSRAGIAHIRRA
jgi:CheY-specific phosphatase CheX